MLLVTGPGNEVGLRMANSSETGLVRGLQDLHRSFGVGDTCCTVACVNQSHMAGNPLEKVEHTQKKQLWGLGTRRETVAV